MNYLKQIREFSIRRKLFPLRATSIAMYYVLLEHFNQARFPPAMPIRTSMLAGELGVTETTIRNCRQELTSKGYLEALDGSHGSVYRLIEFVCHNPNNSLYNQPRAALHNISPARPPQKQGEHV